MQQNPAVKHVITRWFPGAYAESLCTTSLPYTSGGLEFGSSEDPTATMANSMLHRSFTIWQSRSRCTSARSGQRWRYS